MKITLIVISALAGVFSIVAGLPIARKELRRWPRLGWVERNRVFIAVAAILLAIASGGLAIMDARRDSDPLRMAVGPNGQVAPSASLDAVQREVEASASRSSKEALELFRSGDRLMKERQFAAAATAYRSSADKVPTKAALTNLALCSRYASDLNASREAATRAIALPVGDASAETLHANALLQLGITLTELGHRDEARSYINDALTRFRAGRENIGLAAAEYAFGVFEYRGGRTTAALELLASASKRFARQGDIVGQASVMNVLGVAKLEAGATTAGLESLSRAVSLYRETGDRTGEAGALLNIGSARQDLCELDAALSAYEACAKAAKEINHAILLTFAHSNAASAYLDRGDTAVAEMRAREAIAVAGNLAAPEAVGWAHLTLAGCLRENRRYEDAILEVTSARQKFVNVTAVGTLIATLEEARIAIGLKQFRKAAELLEAARRGAEVSDYKLYRPAILLAQADLWEAQGDATKARESLQCAYDLIRQLGIKNCVAHTVETRLKSGAYGASNIGG